MLSDIERQLGHQHAERIEDRSRQSPPSPGSRPPAPRRASPAPSGCGGRRRKARVQSGLIGWVLNRIHRCSKAPRSPPFYMASPDYAARTSTLCEETSGHECDRNGARNGSRRRASVPLGMREDVLGVPALQVELGPRRQKIETGLRQLRAALARQHASSRSRSACRCSTSEAA